MKKYKILYINDRGGWGGAEKVTLTLVKYLDHERYEPHFILGSDGLFAQALRTEGVTVYIVPMTPMSIPDSQRLFWPVLLLLFLARLAWYTLRTWAITRRLRPDLIQTCSIQAKLIGSIVAKLCGTKLLWHVQNIQPSGFRRSMVRFMARRFPDMIVATSQAVAELYVDRVGSDRLQVNHAGIELAEFARFDRASARCYLKAELGLNQQKIIVFASMLRRWKGPHVLVQAAVEILRRWPEIVFLLVGEAQFGKDDDYKKELVELINQLGLGEKVKLLGFRADVYQFIAGADCLVHCPIKSDPLPTVVLEGMALRVPVIGAATGGIPEEIEDQVTGLLFEPGDHIALAKALVQVLEKPDMAQRLTQRAWQKLEAEYSHHRFVKKFETVYAELLP
jgi:glycosyltransferase involved in cell wall biosynthesis